MMQAVNVELPTERPACILENPISAASSKHESQGLEMQFVKLMTSCQPHTEKHVLKEIHPAFSWICLWDESTIKLYFSAAQIEEAQTQLILYTNHSSQ